MKTPDEIKKGLNACAHDLNCNSCPYKGFLCTRKLMQDAAEALHQLQSNAPRWISMEERLPPEGQPVIVFATHTDRWSGHWHAVMEDCWFGGGWDVNCDTDIHKVTHWMSLPEPPVEE